MKGFSAFLIFLAVASCGKRKSDYKSPPGFDFNNPIIHKMPEPLLEISGQSFREGNNDTLYAEQDEEGSVYSLVLGTDYLKKSTFKTHGDFEDMAIIDDVVVMLRSNGKLYTFPIEALKHEKITSDKRWQGQLPHGDYESLYADREAEKLYVLCKTCEIDRGSGEVTGYIFDFKGHGNINPIDTFQVHADKIAELKDKSYFKFEPSALTKNKKTHEWYILSAVNRMLVTADEDWAIKAVYDLDPEIYMQPEGINFDGKHNLFISSEGSKLRMGRVFRINYKDSIK